MNPDKPMAVCPYCGDPLVSTFEFKFKEWICMGCDRLLEWLSARDGGIATPEMIARYETHRAKYDSEREVRKQNGTFGIWPLVEASE